MARSKSSTKRDAGTGPITTRTGFSRARSKQVQRTAPPLHEQQTAARIHDSITASIERRVLAYIAARLPAYVTPDHMTGLGVVGGLIVAIGYVLSNFGASFLWLANLGLVIHWLGDSLDGTLARCRGSERPGYGFFLDQNVDVVTNVLIAVGLGLSPYVSFGAAMLALTGYHMVSIYAFTRAIVVREFIVSSAGFGPTELRLCIIGLNLAVMAIGVTYHRVFNFVFTWCDAVTLFLALCFAVSFLIHVATMARSLKRADEANRRKSS